MATIGDSEGLIFGPGISDWMRGGGTESVPTPTPSEMPPMGETPGPGLPPKVSGKATSILGALSKWDSLTQIAMWQILAPMFGAAMGPFLNFLGNRMNSAFPDVQLTPSDLADSVVRGFIDEGTAAEVARRSGIGAEDFKTLISLAGNAPSPDNLAEALRRGLIPEDAGNAAGIGFKQGIEQGRLADKWIPVIKGLSIQNPTPADVLDAYLQGQTDQGTAEGLYKKFGGNPEYFTLMFNTRGSAPTPMEAVEMANRGAIPWSGKGAGVVSFEQAFLEGPWRNKWLDAYKKIAEFIPTGPEIRSMLSNGAITQAQATKWLGERGMTPEVAKAFLVESSHKKTAKTKELAQGTVEKLYSERLIPKAEAEGMLKALGYNEQEAGFVLDIVDLQREQHALSTAVNRVHTLYISHKIKRTDATAALNTLQVPAAQVAEIMDIWDLERGVNIKILTPAEITNAFHMSFISQAEAQAELEKIGYQPHDAWTLLSIKMKKKLPGEPAPDAVSPLVHK